VKDLLEHIDKLKKQLAQLQPLSAENQQWLDKKFRMEWNFNSNHIEGNTLTYSETELLLIFDQTKGNHELREYEEMKGHDVALKLIYDLATDTERSLSEKFIREINEILLVRPFYKEAITPDGQKTRREIKIGEYKSFPNSVLLQNGEIFHYPSPAETPALMTDLMSWYNETSQNKNVPTVEVAAELHYKFVCIHPFDDGNGRIARLLMNYHLLKNNYPPVIIKTADKKNYLFALREADTGNIEAFKNHIAEQLVWSYEVSIKAGKGESINEAGDWEKKIALLKKDFNPSHLLEKKKSPEVIAEAIQSIFLPFIEFLLKKLDKINDLFINSSVSLSLIGGSTGYLKKLSELQAFIKTANPHNSIDWLAADYFLEAYKHNGLNTFSLNNKFIFHFKDYSYLIDIESKPDFKIENPYHQPLSTADLDLIANAITEIILNKIELSKNIPN
jgi:Fic family protein